MQLKPNNFSFVLFQMHSLKICNVFDLNYFLYTLEFKNSMYFYTFDFSFEQGEILSQLTLVFNF